MPVAAAIALHPRKTPVQARSEVTVAAILEATVQVLLHLGPDRLTTVRVAHRAGVSVGTLYQYFPNKHALLFALLDRKLEQVTAITEQACTESHGRTLEQMAEHVVNRFVDAKMMYREASVALYRISASLGAQALVDQHMTRARNAVTAMLLSHPGFPPAQAAAVGFTFPSVLSGTLRALVEAGAADSLVAQTRTQLILLGQSYFSAASQAPVSSNQI